MNHTTPGIMSEIEALLQAVDQFATSVIRTRDTTLIKRVADVQDEVLRTIARMIDDHFYEPPVEAIIKDADPELEHLLDHNQPMDGCTICAHESREIDDPETHHYINHQMLNLVSPACEFCMHQGK